MFEYVSNVEVVDELERFGKVHQQSLTLVLSDGLEPHGVTACRVHQGIDTLAEYFTELSEREGRRRKEGERRGKEREGGRDKREGEGRRER